MYIYAAYSHLNSVIRHFLPEKFGNVSFFSYICTHNLQNSKKLCYGRQKETIIYRL